jgi:hypothetical protein
MIHGVFPELRRRLRHSTSLEVGRRGTQHASDLSKACGYQPRIGKISHTDCHIDSLLHQVHNPIKQQQARLHSRIGIQEVVQDRSDVQLSEPQPCSDGKQSARLLLLGCGTALHIVECRQDLAAGCKYVSPKSVR